MCGFTLFIGYDSPSVNELLACSERGGDGTKIITKNGILFVFHRLAINGIENGDQPMIKKGSILVCNGEIYNHAELRDDHRLPPCESGSDCEIILDLYHKYGSMSFLDDLDGVFAFVLYDPVKHTLFCARDMYGVRPMYIGTNGTDKIVLGSTLKSIPNNLSIVQQIKPAMYTEFRLHDIEYKLRYRKWSRNYKKTYQNVEIRDALLNAVRKRLMSERPIGCLLSGGLDSSLISGIVVREHIANGGKASDIRTFSIGMRDCPDLLYAKKVADYLGTTHTEYVYDESVFIKNIPNVIRDIGSYDVTTVRASVGNWLIARNIRETTDIKVVFNGDGADEVCSGYLYSKLAPNVNELAKDQIDLLENIHHFDVLRSDRCIASHGLEARTPFLDKEFVCAYSSIKPSMRAPDCVPGAQKEEHEHRHLTKWFLRTLFDKQGYIPNAVLWRNKEAFSDGVSTHDRSWHEIAKDYYSKTLGKKEDDVYKEIYSSVYGKRYIIPYKWMPKWSSSVDPSARTLDCYTISSE
jgi:asparagine synthase (glutamine-hydrolysing)